MNRSFGHTRILAIEGIDGAGKSVLAAELARRLRAEGARVHVTRLSITMAGVFREMVDRPSGGERRYQDVLPGDFRRAAYLVDAIAQFHHLAESYASHDWLLFDRWLPTYDAYGTGTGRYEPYYRMLADVLPKPDLLVHLTIPPAVAAARIRARGDWTVDHWEQAQLLADLERLDRTYRALFADRADVVAVDALPPAAQVAATVLALTGGMAGSRT